MTLSYSKHILEELDQLCQTKDWSRNTLALKLGIPLGSVKKWFLQGEHRRDPLPSHLEKITSLLMTEEGHARAVKVKLLLLLLEDELRWFKDTSVAAREALREELDPADIGYISSLLSMIGEEDKFQRWLVLSTYKFNYFKKAGKPA